MVLRKSSVPGASTPSCKKRSNFAFQAPARFSGKSHTVKFRNKPQGLYFSKGLYEGLFFGGGGGLIFGGKFAFQNRLGWLIDGSKFTVFALFYFVFEDNFPSTSLRGAYIWRGDLAEGFMRYRFGGLTFGGAYFRNFTVASRCFRDKNNNNKCRLFLST